jgi:hypothetical protein
LKKTLILKILYYIFFTAIILIALVIFMEIIDFPYYDENLSGFFRKAIRLLDF